jgi:hypothetical protein
MASIDIMNAENVKTFDSMTLVSVLNQLNFTNLASKVSHTLMTGEIFLSIQPHMVQFVFSDLNERIQFDEFMKQLAIKTTSSTNLDVTYNLLQNSLLDNNSSNVFLNDEFSTTSSANANNFSDKENNSIDQTFSTLNTLPIAVKTPELPYVFHYPCEMLPEDLQSKLRDIAVPINSSDVNELIKQAFNKMRTYKL